MPFNWWIESLETTVHGKRSVRRRPSRKRHASHARLELEELENRLVPAAGVTGGTQQLLQAYGQLPLAFEANAGQTDAQVQYLAHGSGYALFLTSTSAVLSLDNAAALGAGLQTAPASPASVSGVSLAMNLVGANPTASAIGQDQVPGTSNYFIGNDPSQWHTGIANYAQVAYQNVYPGVNLLYYGNQSQLEYDFVVAPGADPGSIRLGFQGADSISLDDQGNLVLSTASGNVLEHAPVVYQEVGGTRQAIASQFVFLGQNEVGFQVGTYDASLPLTIDPVLSYSTYLGGNQESFGTGIAVDASGSAYVTGYTGSTNFPHTTGAFQTSSGGYAFVTKLNATGTALVYSTYLGGANSASNDFGRGIAVDSAGNAYITGSTASSTFPTTTGAYETTHVYVDEAAFVTKLNATGSALIYSSYLTDNSNTDANDTIGKGIAVDGSGNAYIMGYTGCFKFPTTPGAYQTTVGTADTFVTKLNAGGSTLSYSTYLGDFDTTTGQNALNSPNYEYGAIAVDNSGNAYITGSSISTHAALVGKLNATGSALSYSKSLGVAANGIGIAVDGTGNAYVTGYTSSSSFPFTTGAYQTSFGGGTIDAFAAKLNTTGTLIYSTFLGGSGFDFGGGIAVDSLGDASIIGSTSSGNFVVTAGAYQTSLGAITATNAFVTKLNPTGTGLLYSTYIGGATTDYGLGIALDGSGNAYITGQAGYTDFPTTAGAYQTGTGLFTGSAFVAKFAVNNNTTTTVGASVAGSSVSTVTYGAPVTLTATVAPASGSIAPTLGSVDFKDGTNDLGTIAADTVTGSNAVFTLILAPNQLKVIQTSGGVHTITAAYSPGSNFSASMGTLAGGLKVTPASLTITAKTNTKTYDATTSAAATPTVSGLIGSDTVTGLGETYDTANIGAGKTLSVSAGYTVNDGNSGGNYTVTTATDMTGTIVPGPYSKFVLSVQGGNTIVAGNSFLLTAQAADAFGNPVSGANVPTSITATANPSDPQGNFPLNTQVSSSGSTFFLGNLQTAGSYTITAGGGSTNVIVTPASPNYFTVTAPPSATTGSAFNVTVKAFDAFGNAAPSYTGTVAITSTDLAASVLVPTYTFVPGDQGVHTFTNITLKSSTLGRAGTTVVVRDMTAATPPISGFSAPITVQGLVVVGAPQPTATGFTVTFSKPFTPADLTLYGFNTATVPDVTLVGANPLNGNIPGTLFVDPANPNQITFKATNAFLEALNLSNGNAGNGDKDSVALPDDTYTVTLVSGLGGNGFVDALNSHLDGLANGTAANYTATFTTTFQDDANNNANPAQVLSIPDFARGPDSSTTIRVPNNKTALGIPITLYNAAGVMDATFTLTYNPQIFTPSAGGTGDAPAGSTFPMGAISSVDSTHSMVGFTYHNATAHSGTVILGDILATVPNSAAAIYKTKELLALSGITVTGGATVQAADGIHVDAYLGDVHVTAAPAIDASDALDAQKVASGAGTGFSAYTLLDPAIIGNVGQNISVDAAAVTNLFSKAVHLAVPRIPSIPAAVATVSVSGADPTLSLVGAVQANGIVSTAVMLDHPHPDGSTGMTEAHLALTYDPGVLSVSASDITLGSIPGAGWQVSAEVDAATGQIGINVFNLARTPITATQAGSLVNIAFHIVPGAVVPATAVQLVSQLTPNGQRFVTEVDDNQGPLTLSSATPAWPGFSEAPARNEVTPRIEIANTAAASEYLSLSNDMAHVIPNSTLEDVSETNLPGSFEISEALALISTEIRNQDWLTLPTMCSGSEDGDESSTARPQATWEKVVSDRRAVMDKVFVLLADGMDDLGES